MRARLAVLLATLAVPGLLVTGLAGAANGAPPSSYVWAQLPSGLPLTTLSSMAPDSTHVWAQLPSSIPRTLSAARPGSTYVWEQPPASIPTQ
jgi:hypothetical protein